MFKHPTSLRCLPSAALLALAFNAFADTTCHEARTTVTDLVNERQMLELEIDELQTRITQGQAELAQV
ncbi:hypothetical protein [Aliagarivorans marinus]|uniref:hypothetical protein n=1 Tax=Aliagarivorans marinus TaxID=561965 RepID=UPI0003FBFB38|nr:hypothetical protein [Aliagarivorans marinus]